MKNEQYENSKPIEANRTELEVFCKHIFVGDRIRIKQDLEYFIGR